MLSLVQRIIREVQLINFYLVFMWKNIKNGMILAIAKQSLGFGIFFLAICILQIVKHIHLLCAFHSLGTEKPFMYIY